MSAFTYEAENSAAVAPKRRGLFARMLGALMESRMARAHEGIKHHSHLLPLELEQTGWKLSARSEDSLPFTR
jgi:hypothetical protein